MSTSPASEKNFAKQQQSHSLPEIDYRPAKQWRHKPVPQEHCDPPEQEHKQNTDRSPRKNFQTIFHIADIFKTERNEGSSIQISL